MAPRLHAAMAGEWREGEKIFEMERDQENYFQP